MHTHTHYMILQNMTVLVKKMPSTPEDAAGGWGRPRSFCWKIPEPKNSLRACRNLTSGRFIDVAVS